MSEPENFLARWSRRKIEGAQDPPAPKDETHAPAEEKRTPRVEPPADMIAARSSGKDTPAFDISKLPPLESITAGTDVRVFLQAGVPSSLRHAALRRAWVADPAIRDFIGLAENAWDFTKPETIPGFGAAIDPADAKQLFDAFTGMVQEAPEQPAHASPETPAQATEVSDNSQSEPVVSAATSESKEPPRYSPEASSHRSNIDAAAQEETPEDEAIAVARPRSHGGALPS